MQLGPKGAPALRAGQPALLAVACLLGSPFTPVAAAQQTAPKASARSKEGKPRSKDAPGARARDRRPSKQPPRRAAARSQAGTAQQTRAQSQTATARETRPRRLLKVRATLDVIDPQEDVQDIISQMRRRQRSEKVRGAARRVRWASPRRPETGLPRGTGIKRLRRPPHARPAAMRVIKARQAVQRQLRPASSMRPRPARPIRPQRPRVPRTR